MSGVSSIGTPFFISSAKIVKDGRVLKYPGLVTQKTLN